MPGCPIDGEASPPMPGRPADGAPALAAGGFASWLEQAGPAVRGEAGSEVPCGGCTACCRSGQFVHVGPDESGTLARIPPELLFPVPGRLDGHRVLALTAGGHCPLLVDDRCSIYEHRPRACRSYDCRVFAATGVDVGAGQPDVARRVDRWQFSFDSDGEIAERDACRAAATYLRGRDDLWARVTPTPARLAAAALSSHDLFLARSEDGRAVSASPQPLGHPDELPRRMARLRGAPTSR